MKRIKKMRRIKIIKLLTFFISFLIVAIFFLGCAAHSPHDRKFVSDSIENREEISLRPERLTDSLEIVNYFKLDEGLTEEKAVALALWQNPQFQADLLDLGFVRADLIEAGMLKNPVFSLLFPIGPKQLEFALNLPLEFFWQRPYRVAMAKKNAEKVAESLVMNGLGIIREVRISFINYKLARQKMQIAIEEETLQNEITLIASARLRVGEISELEETAFRLLGAQIKEKAILFSRDAQRERIHLMALIGLPSEKINIIDHKAQLDTLHIDSPEKLLERALAARPDLRAAEIAIEAAGEKLGWEKSKIFNLIAVLDANAQGKEGFEMGPGLIVELPIFNWNNAGRTRAKTEMDQAVLNYRMISQKITSEVLQAFNDYQAAKDALTLYQEVIIPKAATAAQNAENVYKLGESSYFEFLEFKRQLINVRLMAVEAQAELRRSIANLKFCVGSKVIGSEEIQ